MNQSRADFDEYLGPAIARIRAPYEGRQAGAGEVFGAGTLVDGWRVVTCAHVVNSAFGLPDDASGPPQGAVGIDFPYSDDSNVVPAKVVTWKPIDDKGGGDLAVLKLERAPPRRCRPADFVHANRLSDHRFRVLGFPVGREDGVLATGVLVGRVGVGRVQMQDVRETGARVRAGFSGAPVWDDDLRGIVGMVVLSSDVTSEKMAFLLPSELLQSLWTNNEAPATADLVVIPPCVDFGETTGAARVEAHIFVQSRSGEFQYELIPDTGFEIREVNDGLTLTVTPHGPRKRSAMLRVAADGSIREVSLEAIVVSDAAWVHKHWPVPPTVDEARDRLTRWAETKKLVPNWLFQGELKLRPQSVATLAVTHVFEKRSTSIETAPSIPHHETYEGSIDEVLIDFEPWETDHWKGILENSIVNHACLECDPADHRVYCPTCKGRGRVGCAREVKCESCKGRGSKAASDGTRTSCAACGGRGKVKCEKCSGTGTRDCVRCRDGKIPCPTCGGDGRYVTYQLGEVDRTVDTATTHAGHEGSAPWPTSFELLRMVGALGLDEVPKNERSVLVRWLRKQLASWSSQEVLRETELKVASVVAVDYVCGNLTGTAYLIGSDNVQAPGAWRPSLRRLRTGMQFRWKHRS
jgi:hypothetical protein